MIHKFTASITRPNFQFTVSDAQFNAVPEWWSDMAMGGPDMAQIRLEGHHEHMAEALRMLNYNVEIFGPLGNRCWWGHVHQAEVNFGGTTITLSLDDVFNHVRVAYVHYAAGGIAERRTTPDDDDAKDDQSITRYGKREVLLSISEGGEEAALRYRDRVLAKAKSPVPGTRMGSGDVVSATLLCKGHWYKLAKRYFSEPRGLVEYTQSGAGVQGIGNFYRNTTISFVEPDQINDSANGLGNMPVDGRFLVRGSAHNDENNIWHTAKEVTAGQIKTSGQGLKAQSAGSTITLSTTSQGATTLAQSFKLPTGVGSWTADRVAVQARKVGTPTDNFIIDIRADTAGEPLFSGLLATATINGATLTENMSWVEADLDTPVFLNSANTYWICVRRSGGGHFANHYSVNVNEAANYEDGELLVTLGSNVWTPREEDASMPFRIVALEETTTQAATIISTHPELASYDLDIASGIETPMFRDGDRTYLDELTDLLDAGTDTLERIVARVQPNRRVRIYKRPLEVPDHWLSGRLVLDKTGRIKAITGNEIEPGQLIATRYIEVEFLPLLDSVGPTSALFVERSRYDASNDQLSFEAENNSTIWDFGVLPG